MLIHLYQLLDRWPSLLRTKVQDCLTLAWTIRLPFLQQFSPASLVAATLLRVLGGPRRAIEYVFVDFASGAGGPTPYIEKEINRQVNERGKDDDISSIATRSHVSRGPRARDSKFGEEVTFILTDLQPHVSAWELCSKESDNLHYVPEGVDAANTPMDLLQRATAVEAGHLYDSKDSAGQNSISGKTAGRKIMRLFSLAFHHFDDDLAEKILKDTYEKGDSFG